MVPKAAPIFVVSAPSGTGKTTLNTMLIKRYPHVRFSVSLTTRPKRPNEKDGADYYFVSKEEFQKRIDAGEMLEWANVFGNLYGTSQHELERISEAGSKVIVEIDVQGWQKAQPKLPQATSIFVLPPTLQALWTRLEGRGTDSLEVRWRRLLTARKEIESGHLYQFFIVNDIIDTAYQELEHIVVNDKPGSKGPQEGMRLCEALLQEFESAVWLKDLRQKFGESFTNRQDL